MVIFGASGDLTSSQVGSGAVLLARERLLPSGFAIVVLRDGLCPLRTT